MPAKKKLPGRSPAVRTQRRRKIAEAVVEQKPPSVIAREIGISRQMVNLELRAPETQGFVRDAMQPYGDSIKELIPQAIQAVKLGLIADRIVDQLRAVKTLGYLMQWTEGKSNNGETPVDKRFSGTLEELLIIYREQTLENPPVQTIQARHR